MARAKYLRASIVRDRGGAVLRDLDHREHQMNGKPLSRRDYGQFLLIALFGRNGGWLSRCCRRAYRDLRRTVRGVAQQKGLSLSVQGILESRLNLPSNSVGIDQSGFDVWHHDTCTELSDAFERGGYGHYCGHAQNRST